MLVSVFLLLAVALGIWLILVKATSELKAALVRVFVESRARSRRE